MVTKEQIMEILSSCLSAEERSFVDLPACPVVIGKEEATEKLFELFNLNYDSDDLMDECFIITLKETNDVDYAIDLLEEESIFVGMSSSNHLFIAKDGLTFETQISKVLKSNKIDFTIEESKANFNLD